MHGAGNDFVVLDLRDGAPAPDPSLCRALADRRLGAGCDQILTILPPATAGSVAGYGIHNADGSSAGQCGNGARCVAAWLLRDGAARGPLFHLDSPAGRHQVQVLDDGRLCVAMGVPRFVPAAIPLSGFSAEQDSYRVELDGGAVDLGAVSMGNPHAVVQVPDVDLAPVAELGLALQRSRWFPESVNVGFAQVLDRRRVRLRVYERGVGETLACGSGACAAAAVLMRRGLVDRELDIQLPGGTLHLAWPGEGAAITMAGPAAFVYEGEWVA